MTTLEKIYEEAEKDFANSGLAGELVGIRTKDGKICFVHYFPEWPIMETVWKDIPE